MITVNGERNTVETVADLVADATVLAHRVLSDKRRIDTLEADVELLGQAEDARIVEIRALRRDVDRLSKIIVEVITPRTLTKKSKRNSQLTATRRK